MPEFNRFQRLRKTEDRVGVLKKFHTLLKNPVDRLISGVVLRCCVSCQYSRSKSVIKTLLLNTITLQYVENQYGSPLARYLFYKS